jgi:hypothetical protein
MTWTTIVTDKRTAMIRIAETLWIVVIRMESVTGKRIVLNVQLIASHSTALFVAITIAKSQTERTVLLAQGIVTANYLGKNLNVIAVGKDVAM